MLEYYRRIGRRLYRIRLFLFIFLAGFLALTVSLIFGDAGHSERFLLPSMVLTTWFIVCLSLAHYFAHLDLEGPEQPGFFERLRLSLRRSFSYFLALLFTVITLLLLYFSTMAIRVALA